VFDLAGRAVATLLRDEPVPAGFHHVDFRRPGLPTGLYMSRLRAGRDVLTRKMLVVR
jgi:hypothetical protein